MKNETGMTRQDTAVLKGVAVLMMVFHHCFYLKKLFRKFTISFAPLGEQRVVDICAAFKICVPIFVFISGYGLTLTLKKLHEDYRLDRRELSRWYVSRYFRLMAGYWFIYLCYIPVGQLLAHRFTHVYFSQDPVKAPVLALVDFLGLSNLFGTPELGRAWWYMSCAVVIVLLVPLFARMTHRFGGLFALAAMVMGPRILCIEYPMHDCAYHFLFAMLLGVVFAEYDLFARFKALKVAKNKSVDTAVQVAALLLAIAVLYELQLHLNVALFWEIKHGLFPLAVILFVVKFVSPIPGIGRMFAFFGKYSMNIFLVHLLLRAHVKSLFFGMKHFLLVGLSLFAVSLVLAIAIEWVKKVIRYQKGIDFLAAKALSLLEK